MVVWLQALGLVCGLGAAVFSADAAKRRADVVIAFLALGGTRAWSGFGRVPAFGTVGLSRGATGDLNDFGKALICVVMFAGRVGPLTFGFFLATRRKGKVEYPTGHVYLG